MNLLDLILVSPSMRNPSGLFRVFGTVARNMYTEFAYAPRGVRRLDVWREDAGFCDLLGNVRERTLLNPWKLHCLYTFARNAARLAGDAAEAGVYKGGSARFLALLLARHAPGKRLLLFDTFEGMPATDDAREVYRSSDLADTSLEEVSRYLADCPNVEFHKGTFRETFPRVETPSFSFVHIDADLYESITDCLEFFYPRLVPGGVLVFDDYGFVACPRAKAAVEDFFRDRPEVPIYLFTGQAAVIRSPLPAG